MWLKIAFLFLWLVGIFVLCSTSVCAAELPPNWPWRGIVITSAASPDEADIKYLASINVNSIELNLDTRLVAQRHHLSPDDALIRDLKWADRMLDECKKYGITGIISISQIPIDPRAGITQESPEFWDDPEKRNETVKIAGILAKHFSNRGTELGAYEVLNEPVVWRDKKPKLPEAWPDLTKAIIKEIRKHDPKRFIIMTPVLAAMPNQYNKNTRPIDDPYIIYGVHMYLPHEYTHQGIHGRQLGIKYPGTVSFSFWDKKQLKESMMPAIEFQKKYNVLIWVGEFSAARWADGANQYLSDLIDIFDKHGWGWAYFQYKSWHGWDPGYDSVYSTNEDARQHYVGRDTERWKLLRKAFAKNKQMSRVK